MELLNKEDLLYLENNIKNTIIMTLNELNIPLTAVTVSSQNSSQYQFLDKVFGLNIDCRTVHSETDIKKLLKIKSARVDEIEKLYQILTEKDKIINKLRTQLMLSDGDFDMDILDFNYRGY